MSDNPVEFWRTCIEQVLKKMSKTFEATESEMQGICDLYELAGGRWEPLATGSPLHWALLRKACKVYLKHQAKKNEEQRNTPTE